MIHSISILNESGDVIYLRDFSKKGNKFRLESQVFNKIKSQRGTFDLDDGDILSYGIVMGFHTFVFMEEELLMYSQKIVQLINEVALYVWLTSRRSGLEKNTLTNEEQYEIDLWFDQVILPSSAYSQLFNKKERETEDVMTQIRTLFDRGEEVLSGETPRAVTPSFTSQTVSTEFERPRGSVSSSSSLSRGNFIREQSPEAISEPASEMSLKEVIDDKFTGLREVIDDKFTNIDIRMKKVFAAIEDAEKKLRLLTESMEETFPQVQTIELPNIALSFIKLADYGPEIVLTENLPFLNPEEDQESFLRRLGAFHMTIVGQGDSYSEGLFGPLPVYGTPQFLSYVYSFLIEDPTLEDERSEGYTYALGVLFFPKDFTVAVSSYYAVQEIFRDATRLISVASEIDKDFFASLREELVTALHRRLQTLTKDMADLTEEDHKTAIADLLYRAKFKRLGVISPTKIAEINIMGNLTELVLPHVESFNTRRGIMLLKTGVEIRAYSWEEVAKKRFRWRDLNGVLFFFDRQPIQEKNLSLFFRIIRQIPREMPTVCLLPTDSSLEDIKPIKFQSLLRDYIKGMKPDCPVVTYIDMPLSSIRDAIKTLRGQKREEITEKNRLDEF
ncbi:MAG: hypothetical protein ACFFBD_19255 [Candidatus Hodarchaeota archaeon]